MPIVTVTALKGRTVDQKRKLAKAITDALVEVYDAKAENVTVIIHDKEKEDLAKAGVLFCDL